MAKRGKVLDHSTIRKIEMGRQIMSKKAMARSFGLSRNTVKKYLKPSS